jgi:hypothetical protein
MGSDLVATFYINTCKYNLWAVYDSMDDYDHRRVSFYDLYDEDGHCLNEGDPYYSFPSYDEVYDFIQEVVFNVK